MDSIIRLVRGCNLGALCWCVGVVVCLVYGFFFFFFFVSVGGEYLCECVSVWEIPIGCVASFWLSVYGCFRFVCV